MRDIVVTLIIFGSLPVILVRPQFGILMWAWLSYMNPQRLTFGFAFNLPFAEVVAIVTIAAWALSREPKNVPNSPCTVLLVLFTIWITITTIFAITPSLPKWEQAIKIILMTFLTMTMMRDQKRIDALVWVIAVSIGFFAIKGGIFTVLSGGEYRIWGPLHSFLSDNNQLALATVMTIPLMRYLQLQAKRNWVRLGLLAAMLLSMFSVFASYSRGAFLALTTMALFMAMKSRKRVLFGLLLIAGISSAVMFMPEKWSERISTIEDYKTDASAQGRIRAWTFAFDVAKDHPILGAGFGAFDSELYRIYQPEYGALAAHSIYFEVLGEHGFVGLFLFLSLGFATMLTGGSIIRRCRGHPELRWCSDLAAMVQVGLVGYAVAGAFLNMAFFDLFYDFVALMILAQGYMRTTLAEKQRALRAKAKAQGMTPGPGPMPRPALARTGSGLRRTTQSI